MKKNIVTSLTLPKALVEKLKKHPDVANNSQAINRALEDYFLLPEKNQKLSDETLIKVFDSIEEEKLTYKFRVRIPTGLYATLKEMTENRYISETATQILAHILYMRLAEVTSTPSDSRLINVMGNKWDKNMQTAIRNINETRDTSWKHSVETCMGGLGIFANFDFAPDKFINDNDWNKANLYKVIQKEPEKLIKKAYYLEVTKETFDKLKNNSPSPSASINIDAAARFLYLNLNSVRGQGDSFRKNATTENYLQHLAVIRPLHKKLNDVTIMDKDIFTVLKKYRSMKNTLFIIDPPYLETCGYEKRITHNTPTYGKGFGLEQHKELAKLLLNIKKNNGNDFIYFCRITVTRHKDQKTKKIKQTPEELTSPDNILERKIDSLYWGKGFYYIDVKPANLNDGTIERIITSFYFEGAKEYGKVGE